MGCKCSTRWTQEEKVGSARIILGTSTFDVPMPSYTPAFCIPIAGGGGGGSWSFKANNPGGTSPSVTLASNENISSQPAPNMASAPFAVEGPCNGSGGHQCDCINTNNGFGTLINTTPRPNENVSDSNLNDFTKDGRWVWTWNVPGQCPSTINGPETTRRRTAKIKHTVTVSHKKYCFAHECPGGGSTNTNDWGNLGTWLSKMITNGNNIIAQASN